MKDTYKAVTYLKSTYETGAENPLEAVPSLVDQRGKKLFKHQAGDSEITGWQLVEKVKNIVKRLQEKGYPITLDIVDEANTESVSVTLLNPNNNHHFVPLFRFFLWSDVKINMSTVHERALGTESVLEEAFK